MGRLSKYKKIKSFDPYSKKNGGQVDLSKVGIYGFGDNGQKVKKRSKKSELLRSKKRQKKSDDGGGFDLPPTEKDEFDLADLTGSIMKQNLKNPIEENTEESAYKIALKGGNVATIPKTDKDESKVSRILKLETQVKESIKKKTTESFARMEGESKRAFNKRTKIETRQIIQKTAEKNPEKRLKKKEFMNNKKKMKKKGSGSFNQFNDSQESADDDDGDSFITGERAVAAMADEVRFGEQAERPPVFRQLPRGAKAKGEKTKTASKSKGMTDDEVEREKGAMEMMRRRVQAQYAAIKEKRKRAGDFHL